MKTTNQTTGNEGEQIAAEHLVAKGFSVLYRNWRHRHWEVDIIASKNNRLHFVEIKTRKSSKYGKPEESISSEKMHNLMNAASHFQDLHPQWKYIQFDVVAITFRPNDTAPEIFVIEDVYF